MPKEKVSGIWYLVSGIRNTKYKIQNTKYCKAKGFTLIELLITISIIGILASLTLASYNSAQAKARDGIRKQDLAQVKRALELAKSDCRSNAFYPYKSSYANLKTFLEQNSVDASYMNPVPVDPKNSGSNVYDYFSVSNADNTTCPANTPGGSCATDCYGSANYTLRMILERTTDTDGSASWTRCAGKPYASGGTVTGAYPGGGVYLVCNN